MKKLIIVSIIISLALPAYGKEIIQKLPWFFEVSTGYESIGYQEHFKNMLNLGVDMDSDTKVSNITLNSRIEYTIPQNVFFGIKTTLPISKNKSRERWTIPGYGLYQTNDVTYGLNMFDLYAGYNFRNTLSSYGGIRVYKGEQFRNNFVTTEAIPNLQATETIQSFGLILGIKGENEYEMDIPSWIYGGEIEGFISLSVNTTNSLIQGSFSGAGGYGLASILKGGYHFNNEWNIELQARYLMVHWNGVKLTNAEWPPNDTQNLGIILAVKSFI